MIFWLAKKLCKDTFFHSPPPFPCNFCKCNNNGIFTASQFYVQLLLLYTVCSNAYSEISLEVMLPPLVTSCVKDYKGHSLVQTSFTKPPNRMPQNAFSPWTHDFLVSQKTMQRHFFSILHPLSLVIFATATVVAFVLLHNSKFNFHCYTQREATNTYSEISSEVTLQPLVTSCTKDYKGHSLMQTSFTELPNITT